MLIAVYQNPNDPMRVYYCSADEKHKGVPAEAKLMNTCTEEQLSKAWNSGLGIYKGVQEDGIFISVSKMTFRSGKVIPK
ncbi:hypothetical protein ACQ0P8_16230 (plasmid) [Halodesulfovibrio aestuarii]|uniref:Uncharacterized protein n=1 Tax=Halodesulfovibrio aestuarii TaxID=126333 RepID=A0A8G2CD40_9BACT|nr:hypothetical protein [Halodesulfovibrio aestuarii]SHJ72536.1 hypothetical protein SAMN05660830_03092 [Halodesulfovibrio aestuarii]